MNKYYSKVSVIKNLSLKITIIKFYKNLSQNYNNINYKKTFLFKKKNQKSAVKKILGSNTIDGTTIIETSASGTNYFAKGHLSPDAGFVYNVMQDATYYFLNVAPQFQSFNNGNWKSLEYAVRDLGMK